MDDSDSQINNPLSNSHVSNFEQEQLIRLEESDCDFECSQNPMLTEEENNEKSVVNSKIIQNSCKNINISESSNQINKKSQFGSFLTSQQLESQQYKISIQQVDSRIGNPSGEEEIHENLRIVNEKLQELDLKVNCQTKEIQEIQKTYNQTKEELQQLKSDNENYKKDNMEIRLELQSYESQIKKVQHLLSLLIQEKQLNGYDHPIQIQNKRSKTTIELSKEMMNNSHTQQKQKQTDSNGSPTKQCETPLSQQQAAFLLNSSKSYYNKPQVQLFNANQLAALLKLPLNRKDEERKDIQQKSAGKDYNYLFHKPTKYSSINLNQVKGQGVQPSYSFLSVSMTK